MRALAAIALFATMSGTAFAEKAEPFGVKGGAAVTDYGGFVSLFGQTVLAPTPHPTFSRYVAHSTEQTGICLVRGETDNIIRKTGEDVRGLFAKIKSQLESRYGPGKFSESFSLFAYDANWLEQIARDEKYYHASWRFEHEGSGVELSEILLYLDGGVYQSPYSTEVYLAVQYKFTNYDECRRLKNAGEKANEDAEASKL